MLRRLTLAIALITGTVQADDFDWAEGTIAEDVDAIAGDADLDVAADGTLSGPIEWSVLRLVLPDLLDGASDPVWIEPSGFAGQARANSLSALTGRVVVGTDGVALGTVRRLLVSLVEGRLVAVELECTPGFDGATQRIVVPWLRTSTEGSTEASTEGSTEGSTVRLDLDAEWSHDAPLA